MVSNTGSCVTCSDYHSQCIQCTGSTCTLCHQNYTIQGITCLPCASFHVACNTCDPSTCLQCNIGYYLNGISCL